GNLSCPFGNPRLSPPASLPDALGELAGLPFDVRGAVLGETLELLHRVLHAAAEIAVLEPGPRLAARPGREEEEHGGAGHRRGGHRDEACPLAPTTPALTRLLP